MKTLLGLWAALCLLLPVTALAANPFSHTARWKITGTTTVGGYDFSINIATGLQKARHSTSDDVVANWHISVGDITPGAGGLGFVYTAFVDSPTPVLIECTVNLVGVVNDADNMFLDMVFVQPFTDSCTKNGVPDTALNRVVFIAAAGAPETALPSSWGMEIPPVIKLADWNTGEVIIAGVGLGTVVAVVNDADGDGVDDTADSCLMTNQMGDTTDADLDGIGNYCDPDFDNSGLVDTADFLAFGPCWNTAAAGGCEEQDMKTTAFVDADDFLLFGAIGLNAAPGPSCYSLVASLPVGSPQLLDLSEFHASWGCAP